MLKSKVVFINKKVVLPLQYYRTQSSFFQNGFAIFKTVEYGLKIVS